MTAPSPGCAFWISAPREGFTQACVEAFGKFQVLDDVSDREVRAIVQRGDLLAALAGVRQGRQNGAIRRAVTLSGESI